MAGVFACCHVIRIGKGLRCCFIFWGGQVICSLIASSYAYDTGEWSFLQGTQDYQLSITHKSAPCAWEGDMRKCSLPIPFYSAV